MDLDYEYSDGVSEQENPENIVIPGVVMNVLENKDEKDTGVGELQEITDLQDNTGFGALESSGFEEGEYSTNFGVPILLGDVVGSTEFENQGFGSTGLEDQGFQVDTTEINPVDSEIFYQDFAIRDSFSNCSKFLRGKSLCCAGWYKYKV